MKTHFYFQGSQFVISAIILLLNLLTDENRIRDFVHHRKKTETKNSVKIRPKNSGYLGIKGDPQLVMTTSRVGPSRKPGNGNY